MVWTDDLAEGTHTIPAALFRPRGQFNALAYRLTLFAGGAEGQTCSKT